MPSSLPPWSPDSWKQKSAAQQVAYDDQLVLRRVLGELSSLPPLVTSWEVERLKSRLADAAAGKRFLLQGGDCSESFEDCQSDIIAGKLKILLQMSMVLLYGCRAPIIRVGRFAGQYAKPRSSDVETRDGVTLPTYRGDQINRVKFTEQARRPDPNLLLRGYERAALTLNFIRALVSGGFADLHHPEYWDLDFVGHSHLEKEYHQITASIGDGIRFMEQCAEISIDQLNRVDFYTSHEGLHLTYEQTQTRHVPRRTGWYDLSTHFPWIGDRTRSLDGAHVEFFRGIQNPIGVKVGPTMQPDELLALIDRLNPDNAPGKLTLIHRFGADKISASLPPLLSAVKESGKVVLWCCDPMHGNTVAAASGVKTRAFDDILAELHDAMQIHRQEGTILGGVHLELTGEDVSECTGGARGLKEEDLGKAYKSAVDPRLNYEQAMETALLITRNMRRKQP